MNVIDRVESAKHTLTGSGLSKAIAKATSHEIIGPKKKHVDYIQNALESGNVSLPDTADMLFERCTNSSWVVVFKALVTFHHLMSNANERFIQYIASKTTTWMLHNFLDKGGVQGYDMSHIIRRYSAYLAEKAYNYRSMGYDFCRLARGKDGGVLRNMESTKLLKALPSIQSLIDSLIACDISSNDLTNGVVTAAFMALFKDMIRLFACYNDGIINLLEKYFEMKKNDCKSALEIYKRFLARMDRVSEFLKVAEDAGIDKGDIPDLTKAPASLLDALESHYQSLEKGRTVSPPAKPVTLAAFNVDPSSSFGRSPSPAPDNSFLKEQQRLFEMFESKKKQDEHIKQSPQSIPTPLEPPSQQFSSSPRQTNNDIYAQPHKPVPSSVKPSDDLLLLSGPATSNVGLSGGGSQMGDLFAPQFNNQSNGSFSQSLDFNRAFQSNQSHSTPNLMDDLLTPERPGYEVDNNNKQTDTRINGDINKGLERVALSLDGLNINTNLQKANTVKGHQWGPPQSNVKTGGANFQMQGIARSTLPPTGYGMNPANMNMGGMYMNQYNAQPFAMQRPGMAYGSANYPMMMQPNMSGYGVNMMGGFNQRPMAPTSNNMSLLDDNPFK